MPEGGGGPLGDQWSAGWSFLDFLVFWGGGGVLSHWLVKPKTIVSYVLDKKRVFFKSSEKTNS